MKRIYKTFFMVVLSLAFTFIMSDLSAAIVITSTPDSLAVVGKQYRYQMAATSTPDDEVYSLDVALEGMSISAAGLITWTPSGPTKGGKVVVRATNSLSQTATKTFFIYVTSGLNCESKGIVGYWKLNENAGPTYIDYCGSNNAVNSGGLLVDTAGAVERAKKFNPLMDNMLSVANNPAINWGGEDSFAIEFWYNNRLDDLDENYVFMGRNEGASGKHWWIGMDSLERVHFFVRQTINNPETENFIDASSSYNTWYHVFMIRDGELGEITLIRHKAGSAALDEKTFHYDDWDDAFISTVDLNIGWLKPNIPSGDGPEKYQYDGKMDDIVIYNKVLSSTEINQRVNGGTPVAAAPYNNFIPVFRTTPATTVNEESLYSYQYMATDIEGNTLTYDVPAKPSWLNWNSGTRTLSGTPSDGDVGTFNVDITVHDGNPALLIHQSYQITVNNVNDKPVLSNMESAALAYEEDDGKVAVTSALTVADVDDTNLDSARVWISANYASGEDVLAFTSTANISGVWNTTTGSLKLTGTTTKANYQDALRSVTYENTDNVDPSQLTRTVSFTANDGELNSTIVTRNITVASINDCPVISGHASLSTPEEDTILIRLSHLTFTDIDDSPGSITLTVASGSNYTFSGNIVTPALNYNGTLNVNVKLSDSKCIVDYVLPVVVTAVNDAPAFNFASLPKVVYEKQTYLLNIRAVDPDAGDVITYSVTQKPGWLNVISDTILTGVPEFADIGQNPVTIRISDGKVNVDTSFIITVNTTNDIPHITSIPPTTINENELYLYNIVVVDTNSGDPLVLTAPVLPSWLTLNTTQRILSGTPTRADLGTEASVGFRVQLKVFDGKQDSTQTFTVTVFKVSGTEDISNGSEILRVFPNPASEVIMFETDITGILNVEIIDITGKTRYKEDVRLNGTPVEINVSDMPNGLYFYKAHSSTNRFVGSIIIKK